MYVFIINPKAGNGKGLKIVENYIRDHKQLNGEIKTYYTEYEGHATKLAEQIASLYEHQIKLLFVVGGDGTIYEVVNGLKKHPNIPISFCPVGSGNDFARGCQTPLNPKEHIEFSLDKNELNPYWLGTFRTNLKNVSDYDLFASSLGFGFDAEVAERVNKSRFKKVLNSLRLTFLIYVIGLIVTIFLFKPKDLTLTIDGEKKQLSNVWLLTVSNHPYFGGGMKIAPTAKINEHHFTVTIVHQISRIKLLFLFITVFFGTHTKLKEVEQFQASHLSILSEQSLTYHADGATSSCHLCDIAKEPYTRYVIRETIDENKRSSKVKKSSAIVK